MFDPLSADSASAGGASAVPDEGKKDSARDDDVWVVSSSQMADAIDSMLSDGWRFPRDGADPFAALVKLDVPRMRFRTHTGADAEPVE